MNSDGSNTRGVTSSNTLFSNAMFEVYLDYIQEYDNGSRYQVFLDALGVDKNWLFDKNAWHDVDFAEKFHRLLFDLYPEKKNIIFEVASSMYRNPMFPRFYSMVGLLVQPITIFSKLGTVVSRMNHYNSYNFTVTRTATPYTKGRLSQHYLDTSRKFLNSCICDAANGSIHGIMKHLGHKLISVTEPMCVKKGHDHCEFEIVWVNRPFLLHALAWGCLAAASYFSIFRWLPYAPWTSVVDSLLFASAIIAIYIWSLGRKSLIEAFEYQQDTLNDLRKTVDANETLNRKLLDYQAEVKEIMTLAKIGEISFSVIHDMASPITLLSFYSEELASTVKERYPQANEILQYSNAIDKATARLGKLTSIFRHVAKSQMSSAVIRVDIEKIVCDCVDLFKPYCDRYYIQIETKTPKKPVIIEAFEGCVETIALNLVQNALNVLTTAPTKQLELEITEDEDVVFLRVKDSGPGIPPERLANLWQRFGYSQSQTQGNLSDASKAQGSGFGLYGIKKTIDKMSADIKVLSNDAGTTFALMFHKVLAKPHFGLARPNLST